MDGLWLLSLLQLTALTHSVTMMGIRGKKPNILKSKTPSKDQRSYRDISKQLRHQRGKSRQLGSRQLVQEERDFRPPLDLPDGFDPSTAERQEDGQFCVFKKLRLEGEG